MQEPLKSLWPDDFGTVSVLTPVAILREQELALGEKTGNIVFGRVTTAPTEKGFRQSFLLVCTPLGYSSILLMADHGIDPYPVTIHVMGDTSTVAARAPEDFEEELRDVFASSRTKSIIASLVAQSTQEAPLGRVSPTAAQVLIETNDRGTAVPAACNRAQESWKLTESEVVNEWIRQGEALGRLLASRRCLRILVKARFPGVVSAEVLKQIDEQESQELLDEWFRAAIDAFIPEHFLAVLRR